MKKILFAALLLPAFCLAQNTVVKQQPTGTGAPVQATSPTLVTPNLGTPTTLVLTNATGSPTGITVAQSQVTGLVTDLSNKQPLNSNLTTYAGITPSANVQTLLSAADYAAFKTSLSLGNVTNESKATMFTNATFTGTFATAAGAIGNAALANGAVANLSGTNTGDQTISDATITTTDITTNNFTTVKHGFVPKGTNVGNFLKDDGTWAAPSGSGDMVLASAQSVTGAKTFDKDKLLVKGTSTGTTNITTANTSGTSYTVTLPAVDITAAQLTKLTTSTASNTASVIAERDANSNIAVSNLVGGYTTTATAAGTTTLTVSSTYDQVFTGATTQDAVLPDATTLTNGMGYHFTNNSTGVVTVKKNGGTIVKAMAAGTELYVTATDISTSAGTYMSSYSTDLAIGAATGSDLTLAATTPTTPAADNMKLFTYKVGGRSMPGWIDPAGLDNAVQSLFGRNGMKIFQPAGNSTTITAIGSAALTATGTATAANAATTNRHTQIRGLEYLVTVAATTAVAGFRDGVAQFFMGNSAGNGGFHFVCRFGPATGVATTTHRLFVGMGSSTAAPTDVEPSSITNIIGVGYDAADANIQFMNNDASGTATKTSLGIAVPTADRTSVYELSMFCAPNSTTVYYTFKDLAEGGSTVSGSVSTDIPAVNTMLASRGWMSVGGTSSVIGIALKSLYIESDY